MERDPSANSRAISTTAHLGHRPAVGALGQTHLLPSSGFFAHWYSASMEGVALPSTTAAPLRRGHPHRHVARVVARRAVLLVGALVLLVDDDEPDVGKRREQGAACAHHHARRARADEIPLVEALAGRHARMHDGHRVAEASAEAPHRLRRQRDLRHQHARACAPAPARARWPRRYTSVLPEPVTPSTSTTRPQPASRTRASIAESAACLALP